MIAVRGLVKAYGPLTVLDGIDLDVPRGTVLALLGPNGAGKTTLIRILATLLRPDAGTAVVAGHDVVRESDAVRRSISLTGQHIAVDELLTGRENLLLLGRLRDLGRVRRRERAAELLEQLDLVEAADRKVATWSSGMRRRLDLAISLLTRPPVLFLDEPTTGLDPRSRVALWELVHGLVRDGTTVLLTTQYLEEADQLADTIAVLDGGQIVARGTAAELKEKVAARTGPPRMVLEQPSLDEVFLALTAAMSDSVAMIGRSLRHSVRNGEALVMSVMLPLAILLLFVYVFGGAIRTGRCLRRLRGARHHPALRRLRLGRDRRERQHRPHQRHRRPLPLPADPRRRAAHRPRGRERRAQPRRDERGDRRRRCSSASGPTPAASSGWPRSPCSRSSCSRSRGSRRCSACWRSRVEGANAATFAFLFLPYVSSAFVPTDTMPAGLRWFAEHQPVTPVIETVRGLLLGTPIGPSAWQAIAWFGSLSLLAWIAATVLFRRRTAR